MKSLWLLFLMFTLLGMAQEKIELSFDPKLGTLRASTTKVRHGQDYSLVLSGINTAHVAVTGDLRSFDFISPLPELLVPLLPGIRDNSAFELMDKDRGGQRLAYLEALRAHQGLERLRVLGDALYRDTRFAPDTALARDRKAQLLEVLQWENLDQISLDIERSRYLIGAVLQNYAVQAPALALKDSLAHTLLAEYATLMRIGDKMAGIDHAKILEFIAQSTRALDQVRIDGFRAEGDVVDLELELLDTYTGDSLYQGRISFATYGNFTFDFSTGFFYTEVVEHEHYVRERDAGTYYVLREDTGSADISIGALAHYNYKVSPALGVGVALGASLSPLDGNLRYLMGPSLSLGHQKQFSLSLGLALARLKRLSANLPRDGEGPYLPLGEPIRRVDKTDTGLFVGISYNLIRRRP